MIDFEKARQNMVDGQIRPSDVTDRAIVAAFAAVPRERFVPSQQKMLAYRDETLPLTEAGSAGPARHLMTPAVLARLIQEADLGPDDVVLDIGTGTGYSAAILASLASSVVAIEADPALAEAANAILSELGVDNVAVIAAPMEGGYPEEGPYDAIILNGSVDAVPAALLAQLKEGGRLLAVVGRGRTAAAMIYTRSGDEFGGRNAFNAYVPALPGFARPDAFVF